MQQPVTMQELLQIFAQLPTAMKESVIMTKVFQLSYHNTFVVSDVVKTFSAAYSEVSVDIRKSATDRER